MKKILKYLRSLSFINIPVRMLVRGNWSRSQKRFAFFSKHWPVYGTIQFSLPGGEIVRIFSRGDDFVSTQAYWKGYEGYEGPSVKLFYHLAKKSACIIDLGANVGYYSLIAAATNKEAAIYAFEPVENIFQRLEKNAAVNNFRHLVPVNAAASDLDGHIAFHIPAGHGMVHASSAKKGWSENTHEIQVRAYTLDRFKMEKNISKISLVKIDCEFHEPEILKGMKNILQNDKPIILCEVLFPGSAGVRKDFGTNVHLEIEKTLAENNYYFYLVNSTALVRVDHLEYNPDDRNYLFSAKKSVQTYLPYSDMEHLIRQISE